MKFLKMSTIILTSIILVIALSSCSGSSKNQSPLEPNPQISDLPASIGNEDTSGRNILAVYDAVIDPVAKTFTITPAQRTADYHFDLNRPYPNVLKIVGYGWTPNFWADIKLTHPFPGSGIDAFDPRVIAILPANTGVSFNYPYLNVVANNAVLPEPDGYTKLFDVFLPPIPGNANPFKAYFKNEPYRRWSSSGVNTEIQRWYLNLDGFGGQMQYLLVVDVSTTFPDPPQPIVCNAQEPVSIVSVDIGPGLYPGGGWAYIDITLFDWQGPAKVAAPYECPSLFTGFRTATYNKPGPGPNEWVFSGTIYNDKQVGPGTYKLLAEGVDVGTNVSLYNEFDIVIEGIPAEPIDITPPYLNFSPYDVFKDGYYVYVASGVNGFHIFDVSDPLNPEWMQHVDTPGDAYGVYESGGYAYVADHDFGLTIIDVDPITSAHVVKTVSMPGEAVDVCYSNGFAYMASGAAGLTIVDVEPFSSAYIVKTVNTPDYALGVNLDSGLAYVADKGAGLHIINITPPETAYLMKSVDTPGDARSVDVSNGYAFVADSDFGLQIIDVDPFSSASIVKTVDTPGNATFVQEKGGYTYVADGDTGFVAIDTEPILSAAIVKIVDTFGYANSLYASGTGYAVVTVMDTGIMIMDILPLDLAHIISDNVTVSSANDVDCFGFLPYRVVLAGDFAVYIIDVTQPDSADLEEIIPNNSVDANAVYVSSSGHACIGSDEGVYGIHLQDPEFIYRWGEYDTSEEVLGVMAFWDDYAFIANGSSGLIITEFNNNATWDFVNSVDTDGQAWGVYVDHGYAYVADILSGLYIIDVDPPDSANIVTTVVTPGSSFNVDGNSSEYIYVADYNAGLQIIDVDPPESASIVNSVDTYDFAYDIDVTNNYAYIADGDAGLIIIDIEPYDAASIVGFVDTPGWARGVAVGWGYAFIADSEGGLRIIELW